MVQSLQEEGDTVIICSERVGGWGWLLMMATESIQRAVEIMESVLCCPECGGRIPVDSKFCNLCGIRLADKSLGSIAGRIDLICPGCGSIMLQRLSYYFCARDDLLIKKT